LVCWFFDGDGTINYYLKINQPQLTCSVTNKRYVDVNQFMNFLGGNIYFDKGQNGYYKWSIQSKTNIENFIEYTKICPIHSIKRNRLFLVKDYYRLVKLKAHKAPEGTVLYKAWMKFNEKWN
jgi:ubiquinol-cytochrome c reductase cytochrome b subunit